MKAKTLKQSPGKLIRVPARRKAKVTAIELSKKSSRPLKGSSSRSSYPEIKALDRLMVINEHWLSDTQFFKDELQFLHSLISKYFVWLTDDENIKSTREIARELSRLEQRREGMEQKIRQHIHTYCNLFENPFSNDRSQFKLEHVQLEKELTGFVKDFRSVKQKTFALTKTVIQSEKIKHLLINQDA